MTVNPRILSLCFGVALALVVAATLVLFGIVPPLSGAPENALVDADDPALRQAAIARLATHMEGAWDSHPDPQVGRTLIGNLDQRELFDATVSSNRYGMRERDYQIPKPPATLRIVILGDSYVFGVGVEADQRLGAHLETLLVEHCQVPRPVECLHLGVVSWNVHAEVQYLRRQLALLRPDVVVQVLVENDLDDCAGVRGFGSLASFPSAPRDRATGITRMAHAVSIGGRWRSPLTCGLDSESRSRYHEAGTALKRLADEVSGIGGHYLAVLHFPLNPAEGAAYLTSQLAPDQRMVIRRSIVRNSRLHLSAKDQHWNDAGHRRIAEILLGQLEQRGCLDSLELELPQELMAKASSALAPAEELDLTGRAEYWQRERALDGHLQAAQLPQEAQHIYAGIDRQRRLAPYAAFVLARGQATHVALQLESIPHGPREGHLDVHLDGQFAGRIEFPLNGDEVRLAVPPTDDPLALICVQLFASDYALDGPELRRCIAGRLVRAEAIRP